ncbi:ABC transporter ATP-binding protein [Olsenella sp. YH-ols2217]|uniref:ABC transporter ATP-binding protein n=1 Tax=Kribbibacterium absianum TaxID=3044210 RepID=A0ABT6ZJ42_9ACTN|nr:MULTISPECIES: ABC transporter ATP-binding protein [unclassified Olsenella]MDJ1122639.1 ABC transporter ATP-binding protein [Olsenella sp. YH-ols2216]MDJ1129077.1 ABC transporter ATP-binding protein [Olsenella sp. YH-ols2217]
MADLARIDGLEKSYGDFHLGPLSLAVPEGQVLGFIGANGSGKTTTIHALFGAYKRDAGTATLMGVPVGFGPSANEKALAEAKEGAAFVFDTLSFGDIRVEDVGRFGALAYQGWDAALFQKELRDAGIAPSRKTKELSRGMGMRLQLAFALAHHPRLLILDEPTAGLDPMAREDALDRLRAFMGEDGHGILMSSHITTDIEDIGDQVLCIDRGQKVFEMPMDDIRDRYGIARCTAAQAQALAGRFPAGSLRVLVKPHQTDVLVPDAAAFRAAEPTIPVERPSLEEFMVLMIKGEKR